MVLQCLETMPYRTMEAADWMAMLKSVAGIVMVTLALSLPLKFQIKETPGRSKQL